MKFAILVTGDPTPYTLKRYGDYAQLFVELLHESGESWEVFDVRTGAFPEYPEAYSGMVLTGSSSDAHDDADWILRLMGYIQHVKQRRVPLLGVCFGHQVLARALGGISQRNPRGWEIGIHSIALRSEFSRRFPPVAGRQSAPILEVHRDHVSKLPPGAVLLAQSAGTRVQAFALGDRVLGIQGHPEFNRDIVRDLVESRVRSGMIEKEPAERAIQSLGLDLEDAFWRAILIRFLKSS